MPMTPSEEPASATNPPRRQRDLGRLAILLGVLAVVGGGAWGPLSWMVASALRPAALDEVSQHSDAELHALIEPARQQLWAITLLFFAMLVILTCAAILLGRRAL